jgi:hypothetical protein
MTALPNNSSYCLFPAFPLSLSRILTKSSLLHSCTTYRLRPQAFKNVLWPHCYRSHQQDLQDPLILLLGNEKY